MILLYILGIVVSCGALWLGADWLVEAAARLAKRFGISELVIGLTVVAFGTSAPEFAVSVGAALQQKSDIVVGNVIGSNIFNIGFILGGCAILVAINTSRALIWRDGLILLGVTVLLMAMFWDHRLSRGEGAVLVALLAAYLLFLFYKREPVVAEDLKLVPGNWRDGLRLVAGLALVVGGGQLLVFSAERIALLFGLSEWVIGMTVVAAGTSLPEFVVSLVAIAKKHHGISAGNLIGSNLFNSLGVLGVAGMIGPPEVGPAVLINLGGLIVMTMAVMFFMQTDHKLIRWEGAALVLLGLAMWGYNFWDAAQAAAAS